MTGAACAAAASDLTRLMRQVQRAGDALATLARLTEDDFGGLSGDSFRRHVADSGDTAVGVASDIALLAGALAALGRGLDSDEATVEWRAQEQWRAAVARFVGRAVPSVVVPGTLLHESTRPVGAAPAAPVPASPTSASPGSASPGSGSAGSVSAAPAALPVEPLATHPLESELVVPPLDAAIVTPAPRCGTAEVILDDSA